MGRLAAATAATAATTCARAASEGADSFPIEDDPACEGSFAGLHVRAAFSEWAPYAIWSGKRAYGYSVDVLEELSRIGGFTYSISYLNDTEAEGNSTEGGMLSRALADADLLGPYWTLSPERNGIALHTMPYLVNSFRVLAPKPEIHRPAWYEQMFNFMLPFTNGLWFTLGAVTLCSGLAMSIIDRGHWIWNTMEDGQFTGLPIFRGFVDATYFAFGSLTAAAQFTPKTFLARVVHINLTFMVLISVAAYTAELAAQLTIDLEGEAIVKDAADFQRQNLPMCVYDWNQLPLTTVRAWHPDTPYVTIEDHSMLGQFDHTFLTWKGLFDNMHGENCYGSVESTLSFEHLSYDKNFLAFMVENGYRRDPTCDFELVGRSLVNRVGAFMVTKVMTPRQQCILSRVNWATSIFMSDVLFISHLRAKWFPERRCRDFVDDTSSGPATDSRASQLQGQLEGEMGDGQGMGLVEFAGIFIIHFSVIFLALVSRGAMWLHRRWIGQMNPDRILVGLTGLAEERFLKAEAERQEIVEEVAMICNELHYSPSPNGPGVVHDLSPGGNTFFFKHVGLISAGGDLHAEPMTVVSAKRRATALPGCRGFCFQGEDDGGKLKILFKDKFDNTLREGWTSYQLKTKAGSPATLEPEAPRIGTAARAEAAAEAAALHGELARLSEAVRGLEAQHTLPFPALQLSSAAAPKSEDSFDPAALMKTASDLESMAALLRDTAKASDPRTGCETKLNL